MDFSDVIAEFAVTGGITIKRGSQGSWSNGRHTAGSVTTIPNVVASFQPLRGSELEMLPEGDRTRRSGKVYTATELHAENRLGGVPADLIEFDGDTWEVQTVEKHHWGEYWKALVLRVGDDPARGGR